jgi:RNA 3'-terminal phosphate cyclase (ATP)
LAATNMDAKHDLVEIDGSLGEGGGQILRTSLALSMITGRGFVMHSIRARRGTPGLRRQHATAVRAAARVCGGTAVGDDVGSSELQFYPGPAAAGEYVFDVGSAGSTMLVLQTVLPALLLAEGRSRLELIGGTHNFGAPPFDYVANVFLPVINRMGPTVRATLDRHGFVPRGGGRVIVEVEPAPAGRLEAVHLRERGRVIRQRVRAYVAGRPVEIARREVEATCRVLKWKKEMGEVVELPEELGPGNVVLIDVESEHVTEVFTGFGQKGVRAEEVARGAAAEAKRYLEWEVPVGEHLADQLMLPLALAGAGSYVTGPLSEHSRTNVQTIGKFLPVGFEVREVEAGKWEVSVRRSDEIRGGA